MIVITGASATGKTETARVLSTLFNIKKKIARVDSEYFLSPLWNTLYNEKSLPVDLVISPDQ